jgi:branched-subunit amino acid transport protein
MDTSRLATIFVMGLLAYLARIVPQLVFVGKSFSEDGDRYLRYISYALICGIIANVLFMAGARLETHALPERVLALTVTIFFAHRTRSALTGMLIGLACILVFGWLR